MAEIAVKDGKQYVRLNLEDIDFDRAGKAQKLTDVFAVPAGQLPAFLARMDARKESIKGVDADGTVATIIGHHHETVNKAAGGDFVVFNIGNVKTAKIPGYDQMSEDDKLLAKVARVEAQVINGPEFDSLYSREKAVGEGFVGKAVGQAIPAATIPFDAVVTMPWGADEFMPAGSVAVRNDNTPNKDKYAINPEPFQNTYGNPGDKQPFAETAKAAIMARKPLVPEVQYSEPGKADEYRKAATLAGEEVVAHVR